MMWAFDRVAGLLFNTVFRVLQLGSTVTFYWGAEGFLSAGVYVNGICNMALVMGRV